MSYCPVANTIEGSPMKKDEKQDPTKEISTRKVIAVEFLSLDGMVGTPDQWHSPYFDDEMGRLETASLLWTLC